MVALDTEGTCQQNMIGSQGGTSEEESGGGQASEYHRNIWEDEEENDNIGF